MLVHHWRHLIFHSFRSRIMNYKHYKMWLWRPDSLVHRHMHHMLCMIQALIWDHPVILQLHLRYIVFWSIPRVHISLKRMLQLIQNRERLAHENGLIEIILRQRNYEADHAQLALKLLLLSSFLILVSTWSSSMEFLHVVENMKIYKPYLATSLQTLKGWYQTLMLSNWRWTLLFEQP